MDGFDALWQAVSRLPPVTGIGPTEILNLPQPLAALVRVLVSSGGLPLDRFAMQLSIEADQARSLAEVLVQKGYLVAEPRESAGPMFYRARLARTRKRNIPSDL
jgi:hypothetical protein